MQYLVSIPLPEDQAEKRKRILSAVVGQLELDANAEIVAQEVGIRGTRGKGKQEVLWQVKLEVAWPTEVEHAADLAHSAEDAGQAALRGLRIPNFAVRVHVVLPPEEAHEGADR